MYSNTKPRPTGAVTPAALVPTSPGELPAGAAPVGGSGVSVTRSPTRQASAAGLTDPPADHGRSAMRARGAVDTSIPPCGCPDAGQAAPYEHPTGGEASR